MSIVIRGGSIVTANGRGDVHADSSLVIENDRIAGIFPAGKEPPSPGAEIVDARGYVVIPGFIQTHVHLCQTLFRGMADDLQLLDWLQTRIFPLEAAHNPASMRASALLGIAELVRSGTTTILDMGSVHHEEEIIAAVGESGMRAFVGKAMMDVNDLFPRLRESTSASLNSTRDLADRWHGSFDGRIRYAVAPRFVLSCSDGLLREAFAMAEGTDGILFHTHASENVAEGRAIRDRCSMGNIEYLDHLGLLSPRTCLAHCIHVSDAEINMLRESDTAVAHCPSSNLKLGSGIAKIPQLLGRGIRVSLGADGAPCNNSLDMFREMRLASLLQKPEHGPTAMPARMVFEMATIGGARALGIEAATGSIEEGKKADLVLLRLDRPWNPVLPEENIHSTIVYSAGPENVDSVMIDGRWVYRSREFSDLNQEAIVRGARVELGNLLERL